LYGSKIWCSNSEYRRTVWQCNEKYRGRRCQTPHLTDAQIQAAFLAAFNEMLDNRAEILEACNDVLRVLTDNTALEAEAATLKAECEVVTELSRKGVQENAAAALDQDEYRRKYEGLVARYETATARLAEIEAQRLERSATKTKISRFLQPLVKYGDMVTEFDEELWYLTADSVTVYDDGRLAVKFRDGSEVSITADIWKAA